MQWTLHERQSRWIELAETASSQKVRVLLVPTARISRIMRMGNKKSRSPIVIVPGNLQTQRSQQLRVAQQPDLTIVRS